MMFIYVSNSNNPENIICMSTIFRGISYHYIHETLVNHFFSIIQYFIRKNRGNSDYNYKKIKIKKKL